MMSKSNLTRTCSVCGLSKPLSAFLQLSAQGTSYGMVCSDCRRTVMSPTKNKGGTGAGTGTASTSFGFKLDARAKMAIEEEQEREFKTTQEAHKEEIKKRNKISSDKEEEKQETQASEKSHRAVIEAKKSGFLSTPKSAKTKAAAVTTSDALAQTNENILQKETALKQEKILTTADMTLPFFVALFHEVRFQSQLFQHFKNWLGQGSPIARFSILRSLEQMYQQNAGLRQFIDNAKQLKGNEKKGTDPLIDYIEQTWKPGGSKKR